MNGRHYQVHHYLGIGAVVVSLPLLCSSCLHSRRLSSGEKIHTMRPSIGACASAEARTGF